MTKVSPLGSGEIATWWSSVSTCDQQGVGVVACKCVIALLCLKAGGDVLLSR